MTTDPKPLLAGYATDTLGEDERGLLLGAALDDQSLFDALVEEEGLRTLLASPDARQLVLQALERPTAWDRVRAWFERPATLADLTAVAMVVALALAGFALLSPGRVPLGRGSTAARPLGTALSRSQIGALLKLRESQPAPAGIEIADRPDARLTLGEPLHVRVTLRAPARVVVLQDSAAGEAAQVWPGLGQAPALVRPPFAGGPAIQPLTLETPTRVGSYRLRLVVAPADVDPGALAAAELDRAAAGFSIADVRYQVIPR